MGQIVRGSVLLTTHHYYYDHDYLGQRFLDPLLEVSSRAVHLVESPDTLLLQFVTANEATPRRLRRGQFGGQPCAVFAWGGVR